MTTEIIRRGSAQTGRITVFNDGKIVCLAESSMIYNWVYDSPRQELMVTFKTGATYTYEGVPFTEAVGLMLAESAGKYLNAHIKGTYEFRKLGL
jgi:hypothetical protein